VVDESLAGDTIEVDGRAIKVTHIDRVLYPDDNVLKADVIAYYVQVAPRLLPHVNGRPVTRIRWPQGVAGDPFFEKNLPGHAPEWLRRVTIKHSDGPITYPFVEGAAGLAWLAQHSALELHVPQWRWQSVDDADPDATGERHVDRLVIDLDPGPGATLDHCAEVAVWLRDRLADSGLEALPVTSGSKGLHLYARWPSDVSTTSSDFARAAANAAVAAMPQLVTATMTKQQRKGRVFIDWSQNSRAKTTVAPYSLRGRARPWVAAPRSWSDVEAGGLAQLLWSDVLGWPADDDPLASLDA
jgi:bifunctional non-homologous end joining protein LigD